MTVDELIRHLQQYPGKLSVYLYGYNGGATDLSSVTPVQVERDINTAPDVGPHELRSLDQDGERGLLLG